MNGWISIIFSVLGGIALLMKSKENERGGSGYTVVDAKKVTVDDVLQDPSILDVLKIVDRDKYESLTRTIFNSQELMDAYAGKESGSFTNKDEEVIRLLEEGFNSEFVGISDKGDYWIEIFTKYEPNIGWNGEEKVGVTIYEVLLNFPNGRTNRYKRNWELATSVNLEHPVWLFDIASFEQVVKDM